MLYVRYCAVLFLCSSAINKIINAVIFICEGVLLEFIIIVHKMCTLRTQRLAIRNRPTHRHVHLSR
jgi:hypothetical protein